MIAKDEFSDIPEVYKELVTQLASIRNKDNEWINRKFILHRKLVIEDMHHGYSIEEAIGNVKEEIKTWEQKM